MFEYIKPYETNSVKIIKNDLVNAYELYIDKNLVMHYRIGSDGLERFSCEYELGYGHCLVTGMGLGVRETLLAAKPEVTKITVVEKCQEIIDWYKTEAPKAGVDLNKFEFITADINTISKLNCDCLFLDHWPHESREVITQTKNILKNNTFTHFWFWLEMKMYGDWVHSKKQPVNVTTFKAWLEEIELVEFFKPLDDSFVKRNLRKFWLDLTKNGK